MNRKSVLMILPVMLLASCGNSKDSSSSDKLTIYTSFYPIYDFATRIAKDKANVINITPAGSEPHDYAPTTREVLGMEDADLILVNGLGLENWTDSLPDSFSSKVINVTDGIETENINGTVDPHVWLNPLNAIKEMENITASLISIDNSNSAYYKSNLSDATYLFTSLDNSFKETTTAFTNKHIVVSHAAFGYLCNHYGLEQIYVDGISPDDEPTAKALEEVIANVKKYNITTIFSEELVSSEIAESIAKKTGCSVEALNPLEGLSEDELLYEDYVSVMVNNMQKLKAACEE
ncbi:MAG: zinc ABC transporter substrate-binding protein [Bacilli bacterium]